MSEVQKNPQVKNKIDNPQSQGQKRDFSRGGQSRGGFRGRRDNNRGTGSDNSFNREGRSGGKGGFSRFGKKVGRPSRDGGRRSRRDQRNKPDVQELESKVIVVRRVTRVVKGGKRMRFSALVVVGDRQGKVGYGLKKGVDFQDAVGKATREANKNLIKINLDENKSVLFSAQTKFKSSEIYLKPAKSGTGLIAGGFVRPVLELAGIENIYSKINGSRNKIVGVQSVIKALEKYSKR